MKKIILCVFMAGCASVIPDQPTTRIEFNAPEAYPEGIAYDSNADVYFVSSARLGSVGKVTPAGVYSLLINDPTFKSTYGVKVHPDGKRLFVCVSDANYSKFTSSETRKKMARLVGIDIATGKKTDDIDLSKLVPGKHFANDLTFDSQQNAYITDSFSNVIYKVTPTGEASVFADSSMFKTEGVGLNGIVFHPSGYLLTVSSGTGSLYKIDLNNSKNITKVATEQFFMNGDGLLLTENRKLVVVQNGGSDKIYELTSEDNWSSAKLSASTLVADRFTYPSTAAMAKDKIWIMNAKFSELTDSTSVPSNKFSIQHARLMPLPR
ncbi:gluconolaconase [Chryseobacterium chendengshani]|uniref:gluconolaconase n=1 Tax=Chryseobacterium sp. LJ668 TaxID=2864040 RepID=UPI001C68B43F|nr:gluconolaconase [Chryseobacterium sp. LJ668]MBW8523740.1 gluconolaconase [Chryseobacterium sp. LJ668]QYK16684.1 gluconolaconase [Chryseobacterium sp. LJ668]